MQSSPISGQHPKPGPVMSPDRSVSARPESSTSPHRDTARLSSRSPNAHPALGGTLRMGSFYTIDSSFTRLREALKPHPKVARSNAPPAVLDELQNAIKVSTIDAEKSFTRRSYALCRLHLDAAKSNQVAMLGKIDDIADADLSADKRTAIRSSCTELGAALTKMLIQAKTMENEAAQQNLRKQKARHNDSDSDATPPSSPPPAKPTRDSHRNSPARTAQKRTQGDADSPVLAQSSPKRQKTDTAISTTTTTTSTATPTTTAAVPQSPPTYRPAPQLCIEQAASSATSVSSASKANKPATGSPTTKASPQKMRALSPQARPRPRSQLFVAPPNFTSQILENAADSTPTVVPVRVPTGATPHNAVDGGQSGADSSGQRS